MTKLQDKFSPLLAANEVAIIFSVGTDIDKIDFGVAISGEACETSEMEITVRNIMSVAQGMVMSLGSADAVRKYRSVGTKAITQLIELQEAEKSEKNNG